jgi:VanZ family protein
MVSFHNLWVADWRVVITIIGWLSILKGAIRILLPGRGAQYADAFASSATLRIGAVAIIAIGAWLCVMAFM